jgi:transketolase
MTFELGPRRGTYIDISEEVKSAGRPLTKDELKQFEDFDLIYRSLCALMYNYVPTSGHPGGSISSGRFVSSLLFDGMDYDFNTPDRPDADVISYAAGHKALGLYAMWALRNEVARISKPDLMPKEDRYQMRLEDLLGFRRNPITSTPLFTKLRAKSLDGHPTPATPFTKLSTGASGVGVATSMGLAYGAYDYYGENSPRVHIVEGEGGMTPGRVAETLAAAGTASLANVVMHVDWNQASIDSNRVCRDGNDAGEYVQWNPIELCYLNDWNVIFVPEGLDFQQIVAAQRRAKSLTNGQPTAIVYSTVKGWHYGIEGKASHGAGHKLCSDGFYDALSELLEKTGAKLPTCEASEIRCTGDDKSEVMETCFWESLGVVRNAMEDNRPMTDGLAARLEVARNRLDEHERTPRDNAPQVEKIFETAIGSIENIPDELKLEPGTKTTLRGELGKLLNYFNQVSGGAILAAAADLLGSTSVNTSAKGFAEGFYNTKDNPNARLLSVGGICEDAISGVLSGLSTYGRHLGVGSSYGAFARSSRKNHTRLSFSFVHMRVSRLVRMDRHMPILRHCSCFKKIFPVEP